VTLFNTSAQSESRTLRRIGAILVFSVVIATVVYHVVNPFGHKHDAISLAIETPYVGQGVAVGTPVIMHGVKIGQVESVSSIPGGGVRLQTDLRRGPTGGLTDSMHIDFRPSNYFGVTGINVTPAQNGRPLQSGMEIKVMPKGNFSLQTLIYRFGELSNGVFNQRLVSVIERATRYVDGLNPLLETVLIVTNSVAKTQTVRTDRLLRNATGISAAFPGTVDALVSTGDKFLHSYFVDFDKDKATKRWPLWPALYPKIQKQFNDNTELAESTIATDEYYVKQWDADLEASRIALFFPVGYLEASHIGDLFPVIESVRTLADTVPKIVSPENFAYTVTELRKRFERMYAGSGDQRALQVRIILDRLPGVAAPLGAMPLGAMGGGSS
jgi:hypothetical protein